MILLLSLVGFGALAQPKVPAFTYLPAGSVADLNERFADDPDFGGISGLEYDRLARVWYLVTDGEKNAAGDRFSYLYTFSSESTSGFPDWRSGQKAKLPIQSAESVRYSGGTLYFTVEDDKSPHESFFRRDGQGTFSALAIQSTYLRDRGFESLIVEPDGALWSIRERPGQERPGQERPEQTGEPVYLLHWDEKGTPLDSLRYPLDVNSCAPAGPSNGNGISEILRDTDSTFLVLERCTNLAEPVLKNTVVLYRFYLTGTRRGQKEVAAELRPLLDAHYGQVPFNPDNLEGMCWGPRTPAGQRTLVLISDDNYNRVSRQKKAVQYGRFLVLVEE
ncbi:esterase-like activity of phytase family protein [Rhabdobacter roseus]